MQADLFNPTGEIIGQVDLNDEVFGIEPNEYAIHQYVMAYLAHQRQGTHKTKTRSEVSGGGKKPWRQKGRGTARAGSSRSPVWVSGGKIHGPVPHKYNVKVPVKIKRLAKKSALSIRASENNIKILTEFNINEYKTKRVVELLSNLKISGESALILTNDADNYFYRSALNIPKVEIQPAEKISAYDIMKYKNIVIMQDAIKSIEEILL
ncbi:MAG TPA: 50S ribosomal protein L4 [Candidatus Kapabacteria bacterium]|nr:50S ribosomal protein L4 [Candidatus Kapabacteria bacterium]